MPPTLNASAADAKYFGIPRYQPFVAGASTMSKSTHLIPKGEEASDEARVWATYLDEAEAYDHDMIQGFRDTIDSLLAGLFSAIVATFVAQTSQSLRPDFAQLNLLIPNRANSPTSRWRESTPTYTTADLWINGLFFTSLSLSVATALLAVLVKQWCQAYASVTSGSARDKVLTRQFRFDGLIKWKLPEIVGTLPLLLHVAFAVFFAGLSYFVYDLHRTLSSIVIISAIIAALLYFGSILLPAIWLECPYRVPLLFRPARSLIYFFGTLPSYLGYGSRLNLPIVHRYLPIGKQRADDILTSLKHAEEILLSIPHSPFDQILCQPMGILARSLDWLFNLSNNGATRRIVTAALYGCFKEYWRLAVYRPMRILWSRDPPLSLLSFLEFTSWPSMAEIAFENATAVIHTSLPIEDSTRTKSSMRTWVGIVDVLMRCSQMSDGISRSPITPFVVNRMLMKSMALKPVHHDLQDALLRWGANVNDLKGTSGLFHAAIRANNLENLQWLIDHDPSVDEHLNNDNLTPLMSACYRGFVDAVRLLIANGADADRVMVPRNINQNAPRNPLTLNIVGQYKHDILVQLLNCGAQLNNGVEEDTALHLAVQKGFQGLSVYCFDEERHLPRVLERLYTG
ncbi:hypothetical protein DL96DRAFT_1820543 [Flagelloscypha sp. PMI_526]|nr:hypothetical protein DL96DRAFT_1820543 [Flagelloscypha sp. PMI_526]